MFISRSLIVFLALAGIPAYAMTIKAPDIAENGAVIPVEIKLDKPLTAGQHLDLLVNGTLAAQVRVVEGKLSAFSARVKGAQNNTTIAARVIANGSELDSASRNTKVTIIAPAGGSPTVVGDMKVRVQSGDLRVVMVSENGFSGPLVLQDSGFRAEISGSSALAKNPFIGVNGKFSNQLTVSIDGLHQAAAKPVNPPVASATAPPSFTLESPDYQPNRSSASAVSGSADVAPHAIPVAKAGQAAIVPSLSESAAAERVAKSYDERIAAAYGQCNSSKNSCDTGCAAGAVVGFLSALADQGESAGEAGRQIQQCSDGCDEAKRSCEQQISSLEQEKSQAVAEAKAPKLAPQAVSAGSAGSGAPSGGAGGSTGSGAGSGKATSSGGQICDGQCALIVESAKCKHVRDPRENLRCMGDILAADTPALCAEARLLSGCVMKADYVRPKRAMQKSTHNSVCERNFEKIEIIMFNNDIAQAGATNDLFIKDINWDTAKVFEP